MKTLLILCLAGFGLCSLKADGVSERDQKFAKEAAMASIREIKMGKLAQTKSSNESVKALGKKMVTDHTHASNELKALASKKGITLPNSMSEKDAKKYEELSQLKGSEFDREFADCALKNHKDVFEMYRQEAMKADDDDFMTYAYNIGFKVEHHVTRSEEVCRAVKKSK